MPASSSFTWDGGAPPVLPKPTALQKLRMGLRGAGLLALTFLLSPFVLLLQLCRLHRPAMAIIRLWARACLWLCGLRLELRGQAMAGQGALVANHSSWIDIFTLLAAGGVYLVSKAEVRTWPLVGTFSVLVRPVFIERKRSEAARQTGQLAARLRAGERLAFFPEGTSTDGLRVLPFKSTLFAVFTEIEGQRIQPVTLSYLAPAHLPAEFYGWWGDMGLGAHISAVMALGAGGKVVVNYHDPLEAGPGSDRKALAQAAETAVRAGLIKRG